VVPGPGMYAIGVLVGLLAAVGSTFDAHVIWTRVVWADGTLPAPIPAHPRRARRGPAGAPR
jgi:hypothetical protein